MSGAGHKTKAQKYERVDMQAGKQASSKQAHSLQQGAVTQGQAHHSAARRMG